MESLEPGIDRHPLDTLTPYSTTSHVIDAMFAWCHKHLRAWAFEDWIEHPLFLGAIRMQTTNALWLELHDLMLEVRRIADNDRPADAVERIVALIDGWDVPLELKEMAGRAVRNAPERRD